MNSNYISSSALESALASTALSVPGIRLQKKGDGEDAIKASASIINHNDFITGNFSIDDFKAKP